MDSVMQVLSNGYAEGRQEQSASAREEGRVSAVKTVSVVLLLNVVISLAISLVITTIVLSEVEVPLFLKEFLASYFTYNYV